MPRESDGVCGAADPAAQAAESAAPHSFRRGIHDNLIC